jgi:hypothetical protein
LNSGFLDAFRRNRGDAHVRVLLVCALAVLLLTARFSSTHAENLNQKYGPSWHCSSITAGLPIYDACRRCEVRNMDFFRDSDSSGHCVPRGNGETEPENPPRAGRSSTPPGQLSDAQCNALSARFNDLLNNQPMPPEYKRFVLNRMASLDPHMLVLLEPERACSDVTVYRSVRRESQELTRRIVSGCGGRIEITDGKGERIDAGNVEARIAAENRDIDEDAARICRVAQQQLAARTLVPPPAKGNSAGPTSANASALALSPAIKKCLIDLHAHDPSQSIDDLTPDELMALCEDYPAVKAAGYDKAFAAYDALRHGGGLSSSPPARTAAAPGATRGAAPSSPRGKSAEQNCIDLHYEQAGAWYNGFFKNQCPVAVEFVFESCGNSGNGPQCEKTTTSLPGNGDTPVSSYRREPKLLSERAAAPFQPR